MRQIWEGHGRKRDEEVRLFALITDAGSAMAPTTYSAASEDSRPRPFLC